MKKMVPHEDKIQTFCPPVYVTHIMIGRHSNRVVTNSIWGAFVHQ